MNMVFKKVKKDIEEEVSQNCELWGLGTFLFTVLILQQ